MTSLLCVNLYSLHLSEVQDVVCRLATGPDNEVNEVSGVQLSPQLFLNMGGLVMRLVRLRCFTSNPSWVKRFCGWLRGPSDEVGEVEVSSEVGVTGQAGVGLEEGHIPVVSELGGFLQVPQPWPIQLAPHGLVHAGGGAGGGLVQPCLVHLVPQGVVHARGREGIRTRMERESIIKCVLILRKIEGWLSG